MTNSVSQAASFLGSIIGDCFINYSNQNTAKIYTHLHTAASIKAALEYKYPEIKIIDNLFLFDKDTTRHKFMNPVKAKLDNVEIDFCDIYDKHSDEYIRTEIYICNKE